MSFDSEIALFTCSYGPDISRCKRLCASVDVHVHNSIEHILVVPRRDLAKFRSLESPRRRVISTESLLPGRYFQLPFSDKWWLDSHGFPVRGWIMQQLTKLSAGFATEAKVILHVDSDIHFIRTLKKDLMSNEKTRLNRRPGLKCDGEHLKWHHVASSLLNLEPKYSGADYIGPLTTWRRDHLLELLKTVERNSGAKWYHTIGHKLRFSEYILYGQFVDRVLQDDDLYFETDSYHCYCVWSEEDMNDLACGRRKLAEDDIAILIQSNLSLPTEIETHFLSHSEAAL